MLKGMFIENCNQILQKTLELAAILDLYILDTLPPSGFFGHLVCYFLWTSLKCIAVKKIITICLTLNHNILGL